MTVIRKPTQGRGRAKYEMILTTAKRLIGEHGNDSVSMREIAKQAGISVASIYQYFPDKNAILAAIMSEYFGVVHTVLTSICENSNDILALNKNFNNAIDKFYILFKNDPALVILWAGLQANPVLRDLDTQDTFANAEILSSRICELAPGVKKQEAYDSCVLLLQLIGVVVRMSYTDDDASGARLLNEYKTLFILRIQQLITTSLT